MKKVPEQTGEDNPRSDSPKSKVDEVIRSLQEITREIEKLAADKKKK